MRTCTFLLLAVALAGCPGSDRPVYGGVMYTDGGCKVGCDKCPVNTFCLSVPYRSVCLQYCNVSSDCQSGQQCALLSLKDQLVAGCVSADRPVWCSKEPCAIQPKCRDAKTLLSPLPYSDLVCGWEVIACPTSCDATTAQCK